MIEKKTNNVTPHANPAEVRPPQGYFFVFAVLVFLLSFSFASAATLQKPPNNLGLVGYWPMNEGTSTQAGDFSGQGNTGTLTNSPTWTDGRFGYGLGFTGSGSRYVAPSAAPAISSTGSFTYSLWIKPSTFTNGGSDDGAGTYFFDRTTTTQGLVGLKAVFGQYAYQSRNNAGSNLQTISTISGITLNSWTHIILVREFGVGYRIYKNGVLEGSSATGASDTLTPPIFSLGRSVANNSGDVTGTFDEFRIYNRALSATEISRLYQSGLAKLNTSQNNKVTNGLVGLWSFDGADMSGVTAYDRSGQGNNGTLTNGPTRTIGKVGQGLNFDGVNDYVDAGNGSPLSFTGNITLSAWVKPDSLSDYKFYLSKYSGADLGYDLGIMANGQVVATFRNGTHIDGFSSAGLVQAGVWQHIVVVQDAATCYVRIYKNGTLDTTLTNQQCFTNPASTFTIGSRSGTGPFSGGLDDVRVYDRALTQSEITQLYNAGGAKMNASQNNVPGSTLQSGLVGLWSFNGPDMSGVTAYDRSGQGNNGTLTNGPTRTIGKVGQGLNFDGVNDYVDAGSGGSLTNMTAMSIVSWIRPSTFATHNQGAIIYKNWYFATCRVGCGANNVLKFNMSFDGAGNATWISPVNSIKLDEWQQVVVTYDRSSTLNNPIFYINGVSTSSTQILPPVGAAVSDAAGSLYLGLDTNLSWLFSGSLDEVRIYNRILSAAEVKQLYLLGR